MKYMNIILISNNMKEDQDKDIIKDEDDIIDDIIDDDIVDQNITNWLNNKISKQKEINKTNREYLISVSEVTKDDNGKTVLIVPEGIRIGKGNINHDLDYNDTHIIPNVSKH
jgi:hypothetical protein